MIQTPEEIRHAIEFQTKALNKLGHKSHTYYLISGYFDPVHPGHLSMIKELYGLCKKVIVVVNGDGAARIKKGFSFMDANVRAEIMDSIRGVHHTCIWNDVNISGCLDIIKPHYFVNGGDRSDPKAADLEEATVCSRNGIKTLYGIGGTDKPYASSRILQKYEDHVIAKFALKQYEKQKEKNSAQQKAD